MAYISEDLHSIKEMINVMDEDVLDRYCQQGCLDEETVEKIENVVGYLAFSADEYDAWASINAGHGIDD